jgi:hypothetical protein
VNNTAKYVKKIGIIKNNGIGEKIIIPREAAKRIKKINRYKIKINNKIWYQAKF